MAKINWANTIFVLGVPFVALVGNVFLFLTDGYSILGMLFATSYFILTAFTITAGYHRLFSHRTYVAITPLKWLFLLIGPSAFQWSALRWAANHRLHHMDTDGPDDPYSVTRGFWWAHMGWIIRDPVLPVRDSVVTDLKSDPAIAFQDRYNTLVGVFMGFVLPLTVGLAFGRPLEFLIIGGFTRLAVIHFITFSINSIAHTFGRQTRSEGGSARDSHLVGLLTFGEGYHNYHHAFPRDYRNGHLATHLDSTKWLIFLFSKCGLAHSLRRANH